MNRYTVNGLERVSRAQARRLFSANITPIFACPCKLRPGGAVVPGGHVSHGHGRNV